jgi:hypothetical protein
VDAFLLAAVEDKTGKFLQRTARATLHAIHSIFQALAATGMPDTKDPVSKKNLAKGDARWDMLKEILGYWLDGRDRTVQLPLSRATNLLKKVKRILKKERVPLKHFRSIAGQLQHAAHILPAAKAFFTPINNALGGVPISVGLGRHGEVCHAPLDMAAVICNLASRPTHVSELVQKELDYIGYCDASTFGAGGVLFGEKQSLRPILWIIQWPADLTNSVLSEANPTGQITNLDLEMAGILLHEAVLKSAIGKAMVGALMAIGCDNSPAIGWTTRMATPSETLISFRLLQGLATRQ